MSRDQNLWIGRGRMGGDVELERGEQWTRGRFSIACNRPKGEEPDWIRIVVWDRQAEIVAEWGSKGRFVAVEGRLHVESYTDRNGVKRTGFEIVARRVDFLDAPKSSTSPEPRRDDDRSTHGPGGHRYAFDKGGKR